MKSKRFLVLGAGGLMGRYVVAEGLRRGMDLTGYSRQQLDITQKQDLLKVIDELKPDWILNAAACARMELCAQNPDATGIINRDIPAWLAEVSDRKGIGFGHVSSDYIFDGKSAVPYTEEAKAGPLSEYARQKAEADEAVSRYPQHLILRVAWLFGKDGATFMSKMPRMLLEKNLLQVAAGRRGNCLYMGMGAQWTLELMEGGASGIYNLVHPGETTWEEFARFTLEELKLRGLKPKCGRIESIPMSAMGALQEPRPEYSVLSIEKLQRTLGRPLEDWKAGLKAFLDEEIPVLKL